MPEPTDGAADRLVGGLITEERRLAASGRPVRVTWVNHYSVQGALRTAADDVRTLEVCGVDGQLLRRILGHPVRTSADLVVPVLLERDESIRRVLAIGGRGDRGTELAAAFGRLAGRPIEVRSVDGYEGLPRGAELQGLVGQVAPDLLLVGMGAGLQERVLVEGAAGMRRGYALTCGGFLDQVLQVRYYPAWAYPLHLNWLVRLLREPRRLWRRYSVDALRAVAHRSGLRAQMGTVPGMQRHAELCRAGAPGPDGA